MRLDRILYHRHPSKSALCSLQHFKHKLVLYCGLHKLYPKSAKNLIFTLTTDR